MLDLRVIQKATVTLWCNAAHGGTSFRSKLLSLHQNSRAYVHCKSCAIPDWRSRFGYVPSGLGSHILFAGALKAWTSLAIAQCYSTMPWSLLFASASRWRSFLLLTATLKCFQTGPCNLPRSSYCSGFTKNSKFPLVLFFDWLCILCLFT